MTTTIIIICPNLRCRSVLQVPESVRGKKVRCGHCGTPFVVPSRPEVTAAKQKADAEPPSDE